MLTSPPRALHPVFAPLAVLALGCGRRDIPVEHVKYNESAQQFQLGVTRVSTFKNRFPGGYEVYDPNVNQLEGEHVVVKGGGSILFNTCRAVQDSNTVGRQEYYQSAVVLAPAPVNLQYSTRWDGTYVATEHDSLSMLSAYVNFDQVSLFYRALGDTTPATETRAVLAFYGEGAVGCGVNGHGVALPMLSADNAAYVSNADVFLILRDVLLSTGLELGAHPGVAAHEYGHRIFHHNVYRSEKAFHMLTRSMPGSTDKREQCFEDPSGDGLACKASFQLLKGVDEGTADVMAYTYTGRPAFFAERIDVFSGLAPAEAPLRDLSRDPVPAGGELPLYGAAVRQAAADGQLQFYRLGTLWSRGYYHSIVNPKDGAPPTSEEERVAWARTHYAPAVIRAENRLGEDFTAPIPATATQKAQDLNYLFDPRQFLRRYIEEVSVDPGTGTALPWVKSSVCQELCNRFGDVMPFAPLNNAPAQCAGVMGRNDHSVTGVGVFPCAL